MASKVHICCSGCRYRGESGYLSSPKEPVRALHVDHMVAEGESWVPSLDATISQACSLPLPGSVESCIPSLMPWDWCLQEEMKGTLDGELATVLSSIATACKQIASLVTRAGISNLTGLAGAANIQVSCASTYPNRICDNFLIILPNNVQRCMCTRQTEKPSPERWPQLNACAGLPANIA